MTKREILDKYNNYRTIINNGVTSWMLNGMGWFLNTVEVSWVKSPTFEKQIAKPADCTLTVLLVLQSDTTYRVCLAYQDQSWADPDKCETITTLKDNPVTPRGITDYSLYGIIVAAIVCFLIICIIGKRGEGVRAHRSVTSRRYSTFTPEAE